MKKQKRNVHRRIRLWYVAAARDALQNEEVMGDWVALWKGMRAECARDTGLAVSTVNRYWGGAITSDGKLFTFDALDILGLGAFNAAHRRSLLWF